MTTAIPQSASTASTAVMEVFLPIDPEVLAMPIRDLFLDYGHRAWLTQFGFGTVENLLNYRIIPAERLVTYRVAVTHGTVAPILIQRALEACGITPDEMPRWVTQYV